jgi:Rrf2 family protein
MLKLSRKVEYGLMALKKLNSLSDGQTLTVKEIATADKIPEQLLSKLMQLLAKDEIVESIRGTQGGYKLKMTASDLKQ